VPNCDGIFGCGHLETLEFDHCRVHPEVVDVGKLPDNPRRHCGQPPRAGCLDDVINVYESKIYLQSGTKDTHTPRNAVVNTFALYGQMTTEPDVSIKFNGDAPLGHELPTNSSSPALDGPGECLDHVHGK
jgi:hypothetical protein